MDPSPFIFVVVLLNALQLLFPSGHIVPTKGGRPAMLSRPSRRSFRLTAREQYLLRRSS